MTLNAKELKANFYINLLRQLPGMIVVMDKESKFIYSNKYTAHMFGYTNEDSMLGLNAYHMRCPAVESASDFIKQDQMVIQTGKELTMLDIHHYANDKTKILITKKSPYVIDGDIAGSICHCTEINSDILRHTCATLIESDRKYYTNYAAENRSYVVGTQIQNKHLSSREMDCVFYLLRGNTMKMIAKYLGISPRTVETHLEQIKLKLNCSNKSDIVEACLAEGLLNYIPSHILSKNISSIVHMLDNVDQ